MPGRVVLGSGHPSSFPLALYDLLRRLAPAPYARVQRRWAGRGSAGGRGEETREADARGDAAQIDVGSEENGRAVAAPSLPLRSLHVPSLPCPPRD